MLELTGVVLTFSPFEELARDLAFRFLSFTFGFSGWGLLGPIVPFALHPSASSEHLCLIETFAAANKHVEGNPRTAGSSNLAS